MNQSNTDLCRCTMFVIKWDTVYIFNKVNIKYLNNLYFHIYMLLITARRITAKPETGPLF